MSVPAPESTGNQGELIATASGAVLESLKAAFRKHEELGEAGTEEVSSNQYGDVAMRGDVEAEDVLIDTLNSLGIHIKVFSEEHGEFDLNPDYLPPKILAVMDGLDGSSVYKKERGVGRYGTMLALLEGDNPRYEDYLAAGVMEHSTKRLFLAVRDQGLEVSNVETGEKSHPTTKSDTSLGPKSVIFVDNVTVEIDHPLYSYYAQNQKVFAALLMHSDFRPLRLASTAAHFVSVAIGEADLVCEATRKGNLEFATAYALLHESGGVMVTLDGQDIGSSRFLDFGQTEHVPIMGAANQYIARDATDLILQN